MATMRGVFVLCLIQSVEVNNALLKDTDWFSQGQETLRSILDRKNNENVAKNVILFLGDGMGVSTVTAARIYKGQLEGRTGEEEVLSFETFPHTGLSKTYNVDKQVADSAGTANAYLCGVKTEAGVVGLNQHVVRGNCTHKEGNEIPSIVQWSHDAGKATGVVTTARITHATPSAAYAHSPERDWESDKDVPQSDRHVCADIAMQLVRDNSYIQVLLGGGRRNFLPAESPDPEYEGVNGTRLDGRNLMEEWVTAQSTAGHSHAVVWNQSHFDDLDPDTTDYLLGLFEPSHMRYEVERDEDVAGEPSLAEMTEKAIRILSRQNGGYFLLVEGGRIDHGHHDGLAKKALHEVVAMDAAVEKALRMTDADDTLIVVTADHSHVFTMGGYPDRGRPILGVRYDGEGEERDEKTLDGLPVLTLGYTDGPGLARANLTGVNTKGNNYVFPSAVPMKSETHGGEDVAVYARGPMSHLFSGVVEQSYLAHAMAYASCVGTNKGHCDERSPKVFCSGGTVSYLALTSILCMLLPVWVQTSIS